MSNPVKYTFDQAFDGGAKSRYDLEIERLVRQGEEASKESYTKGVNDGRVQALQEIENATKDAIVQLTRSAEALFEQRSTLESSLKQEMVHLSYAIASKLSGALLRTKPTAEVQALIEDCLATVSREPRIVVRVSENVSDAIASQLDAMKSATSFAGEIVLIGEPTLGDLDCRIEWPDGGTERKQDAVKHQIEDAVQRFVLTELEENMETDPVIPDTASA